MKPVLALTGALRVLLRAATAKDDELMVSVLSRQGIATHSCVTSADIVREMAAGAGALIVSEETLLEPRFEGVISALRAQPDWSDLPMIVLASPGADSPAIARVMEILGSITVLERPTRRAAFVSATRAALAARERQYMLRDTLDGLREADQRKTEFLATLAHELRNPLAPVRSTLAMLQHRDADPETRRSYDMMTRQVEHMVRLVDDLLEVSRITRGKIELHLQPVDVLDVLRDAVDVSRPVAQAAGQRVVLHLPQQAVNIEGDKVRLVQVFANLINNASRYSPEGASIDVELVRSAGGDEAEVVVRDQGIGIPADMLASVFEMFVQVAGAAHRAQGGLGIGLTLVRKLVELHGGRVSARSDGPGKGAEFRVALPMREAHVAEPVAKAATADMRGHRILIVDDNVDAADSLAALLGLFADAQVHVAYGGPQAIKLATQACPTIGILDVGMPEMDGCELARRLRALPETAGMYLVALTGWGQESDRLRVSAAGFNSHLLKPVEYEDLLAALAGAPRAVTAPVAPAAASVPGSRSRG